MFLENKHPQQSRPPTSSESMLAACLAAMATLLLAPLVVNYTSGFALRLAENVYGIGSAGASFVGTAYDLIVWPTIFFALKTSIQTALMVGIVSAAIRLI